MCVSTSVHICTCAELTCACVLVSACLGVCTRVHLRARALSLEAQGGSLTALGWMPCDLLSDCSLGKRLGALGQGLWVCCPGRQNKALLGEGGSWAALCGPTEAASAGLLAAPPVPWLIPPRGPEPEPPGTEAPLPPFSPAVQSPLPRSGRRWRCWTIVSGPGPWRASAFPREWDWEVWGGRWSHRKWWRAPLPAGGPVCACVGPGQLHGL